MSQFGLGELQAVFEGDEAIAHSAALSCDLALLTPESARAKERLPLC